MQLRQSSFCTRLPVSLAGGDCRAGRGWLALLLLRSPARFFAMAPFGLAVAVAALAGAASARGSPPPIISLAASELSSSGRERSSRAGLPRRRSHGLRTACAWLGVLRRRSAAYTAWRRSPRRACSEAERWRAQADRLAQLTAALSQARTSSGVIDAAVQEPLHASGRRGSSPRWSAREGGRRRSPGRSDIRTTNARPARASCSARKCEPGLRLDRAAVRPSSSSRRSVCARIPRGEGHALRRRVRRRLRWSRSFSAAGSLPSCSSSSAAPATGRQTIARTCSRSARAPPRRSIGRSSSNPRFAAAPKPKRCRPVPTRSSPNARKWSWRCGRARRGYRALAARTGRLHGLASALSEAVTMDAVARAVVRHGGNVLGATNGEVWRLTERRGAVRDGLLGRVAGPEPNSRRELVDADPGLCATHAVRTRSRYSSPRSRSGRNGTARQPPWPRTVVTYRPPRCRSSSTDYPPACSRSTSPPPSTSTRSYQALLISVAQHCAQALERRRSVRGGAAGAGGGRNRQSPQGRVRLDCLA